MMLMMTMMMTKMVVVMICMRWVLVGLSVIWLGTALVES